VSWRKHGGKLLTINNLQLTFVLRPLIVNRELLIVLLSVDNCLEKNKHQVVKSA
jgi:hypothetical protein